MMSKRCIHGMKDAVHKNMSRFFLVDRGCNTLPKFESHLEIYFILLSFNDTVRLQYVDLALRCLAQVEIGSEVVVVNSG
jgi:hypothetical protein